jgi:NADPH:quinone reductase-like Zn-dependent oxidoreductase
MRAITISEYGMPDCLKLTDVEKPVPGEGEVLVKVMSASVNSWDWDFMTGKPHVFRLFLGLFKPKYKILGCDIAGVVETTGKNVTEFSSGDLVYGDISDRFGAFAEYVVVSEKSLRKKPESISFHEAAALPQAGVLALQCFNGKKKIKSGDKILINGAGGGVGTIALQIAKSMGAIVTCVDCKEKFGILKSLGADEVIDYKKNDFTLDDSTYDLIIDVVASRSVFAYRKCLKPGGVFLLVGGKVSSLLQTLVFGSLLSVSGSRKLEILIHQPNKDLERIGEMLTTGKIKPVINKIYSLENTPAAMQDLGMGRAIGKQVIEIGMSEI